MLPGMDTCDGRRGMSRRDFLQAASAGAGGLVWGSTAFPAFGRAETALSAKAASPLPEGAAPAALALAHFPSRLHAFVWRNWSLVPLQRMAAVVGARKADLARIGRASGLGSPPHITRDQQARSYITVIKRNWHLLAYDQLLALLGWTAERLDYTLREDDFLFVKLGNLKPRCEPLRYQAPTEPQRRWERETARILRADLPFLATEPPDPLFGFVARLSSQPETPVVTRASDDLRFCYSYFALYGDPLLEASADPYPDGYLARLAQAGVNGVWLQAVLYKLAPFPWDPGRSAQYLTRLKNLQRLVARARRYGIRVFLYLNEPRAMPLKFFSGRPQQLQGVVEGDHAALCTSQPEVQRFLVDSVAGLCRAVPDLGGFFTITASENLTNCWSHGGGASCARCGTRPPATVIDEVNRLFWEGIRKADSKAKLIAWDWGWNDAWAGAAIGQLPAGVALMSVSEWQSPLERGGVKTEVGEYSISAIGPGPRARCHWELARARGLETIAKIQAGNTWELSAVPAIPAVENVARHAENLRQAGVGGFMLGWTLGGYPSPNLEVVSEVLACGSAETAMQRVAERRFGKALAPAAVTAWRQFSAAFREFPFHIGVLYSGPQQLGPANLLWGEPTHYSATMTGFPYDDLDAWRAVYPAEVFIQQLDRVADGFTSALARLRTAAALAKEVPVAQRRALEAECRVAEATALHFRSTANQARFVVARRAVAAAAHPSEAAPHLATLERVLHDEIRLARNLCQLQQSDSRLGFEASNQYFYVPLDLVEKVLNCRDLLARWLPGLHPTHT